MRALAELRQLQRSLSRPWLIVVHSHLRWDFVWQRPQQLLSRFTNDRIVFVEEPVYADDVHSPRLQITKPHERVLRVVPVLPAVLRECHDESHELIRLLLTEELAPPGALAASTGPIVQWFYTPLPAPVMLDAFEDSVVVYDCMDELSKFRYAPPELSRRERLLLSRADVVFTGGHRLFESKSRYHANVHFFGCGVDAGHFAAARLGETRVPSDVSSIQPPLLGYFGVIDERLDYELLGTIAAAHPEWSLVMIGPLAKVSPAELPVHPNIHWLGQRDYTELPAYVKAFDVCLMPFALNDATEFINPTKTLEYMAGGKPVVSTAVPDVVHNFAPIVRVARSPEEFMASCAAAMDGGDEARVAAGIERAEQASWESIVSRMRTLIGRAMSELVTRKEPPPVSGDDRDARPGGLVATAESRDEAESELP